ncbi:MAG: protease modulator HflC [Lentisphaeria bacterium]
MLSGKNSNKEFTHWPVLSLALIVLATFIVISMTFQVKETEYAVLKFFGKPKVDSTGKVREYSPGLHFRWPFIDQVWRHDKRLQCYELHKGKYEQLTTKDEYQIVLSTYVLWRVGDPGLFLRRMKSTAEAEANLEAVIRNSRAEVIPQHNFADLVNTKTSGAKMKEIEDAMLKRIQITATEEYGIEVAKVGIRKLGFPEAVSSKVFDRMKAERASKSEKYLAEGKSEAQRIRSEADRKSNDILAEAEADAKRIRGQGDEAAARHYAVFRKNPELAKFLRSLEALKISLSENDTLILDTETPPFTLFKANATELALPVQSH